MRVRIAALLLLASTVVVAQEDATLISVSELEGLMDSEEAYVIDVRDLGSYLAGHIPGAYAIPLNEIPNRYDELSQVEGTIVTYCACPAEETSLQAAFLLSARGIAGVRVLEGGIIAWQESGSLVRGPRRY